jgi:hypothetical protein
MARKNFSFPITTLAGSNLSNFIAICGKHRISPSYYSKLVLSFLGAAFLEPFSLVEKLMLNRKLKSYRMEEPPVFIIGFWRSGTTLLHELLCKDPCTGYTSTFQVVFPNVAATQAFWLKRLTNLALPGNRPLDGTSWSMDSPQEEEFGMANLQSKSLYNFLLFPSDWDLILKEEFFTGNLSTGLLSEWEASYRAMVNKAMLISGGSRYISKNPCNLGRIDLLRSMFPGARFIFIYRDPYCVVESTYHFFLSIFPGVKLQNVKPGFSRKDIVDLYCNALRNYFKVRSSIPSGDLIEIRMEDFVRDQLGTVKMIYDKFGFDSFGEASPFVEKSIKFNGHFSGRKYDIPPETYDLVNEFAPDILAELHYEKKVLEQVMSTCNDKQE